MPMITPDQAQAKWVRNTSAATQSVTDGVRAVTVAPGVKAAAQAQVWLTNLQASADKWKANVQRVTLGEWQQAMIDQGIPRMQQGVTAKQAKYGEFAAKFFPYVAQGAAAIAAMPKGSTEAGINRAVAMIRHNAAYKG